MVYFFGAMAVDREAPTISVCIPAFKQPANLKRAVSSVFRQTWQDWELIVSDDEDPPGETWEYLQELAKQDGRVRVMRNPERHGQVPNTNHVMLAARGAWIKPLHHDDVLRPQCLATLLGACRGLPSVALVSCLTARYVGGAPVRELRHRGRATLELIPQKYAHLGMYLQDCNVGLPTEVMVRREAIAKGALFEDVPGVVSGVDALWDCAVLKHGDVLFVNRVLVEHHQHGRTITSSLSDEQIEAEYPIILAREFESIDPALKPPPLSVVLQMVKGIRALHRLKNRKVRQALDLFWQVRSPAAWALTARWVVNQALPGLLHMIPRIPLEAQSFEQEAGPGAPEGSDLGTPQETRR